MAQLHGQLQLLGFAGLFVMGMSFRIMPRVSGRPLAFQPLIPWLIALTVGYLALRSTVHPLGDSALRDAGLIVSAAFLLSAAAIFAAITWSTLLHPASKAEATGYFFVLGAAGLLASAAINAVQAWEMVRDSSSVAQAGRQSALVFMQQFGFLMMFVGGVGSRAIPGLTGRPRRQLVPRVTALVYAAGVAAVVTALLIVAERRPNDVIIRAADVGLIVMGASFAVMVWSSGALAPGSNVAQASRLQFWFVRCAFAWLLVSSVLMLWYGGQAFVDARLPDQFEMDAIRHAVTLGVLTTIILGMAMLIVPEFAARRLQHPRERWLHLTMIVGLVVATGLRLWPAFEGIDWLEDSRFWPMAISAAIASGTVAVFAAMFAQSWWEQRDPAWAARATGVSPPTAPR
jgi:hypothetical protein